MVGIQMTDIFKFIALNDDSCMRCQNFDCRFFILNKSVRDKKKYKINYTLGQNISTYQTIQNLKDL